jgi:hypothetical protein
MQALLDRSTRRGITDSFSRVAGLLAAVASFSLSAHGAIVWDGEAGTPWWFNPVNWNVNSNVNNLLPPNGGGAFDAQINSGSGAWNQGEGVVYDPANDPHFAAAGSLSYPPDRGPQIIDQLYISRNTPNTNLLTIKGDLTSMANVIVGRSGSTLEAQNLGRVNQLGGTVRINSNVLDLGNREASGWGNGIYDYRGGVLEVSLNNGNGIRLSAGGSAGTGGHGRFIMHNPTTPGYVRTFTLNVAAHAGIAGNPDISANGETNGVGIVEFHYENGGVRPIQVVQNLIINNGAVANGTRSARLDFRLDSPVTVNGMGVPINLGLFDVDFEHDPVNSPVFNGVITGDGDKGDFFSSADGSVLLNEGATVSATFGNTTYNWMISYTGNITWTSPTSNVVDAVTGPGTGTDVVLIGVSSQTIAVDDADFDNDGDVDGSDFLVWQRGVGVGNSNATGDANGDGMVNGADLGVWRTQFGPAAPPVSAIPEPAFCVLLALVACGWVQIRRR